VKKIAANKAEEDRLLDRAFGKARPVDGPEQEEQFSINVVLEMTERRHGDDQGKGFLIGHFDVLCNGVRLGVEDIDKIGYPIHGYFHGSGERIKVLEIFRRTMEHINKHFPAEALALAHRLLVEGHHLASRELSYWPPGQVELEAYMKTMTVEDRKMARARLGLPGRGGKSASWTDAKKLQFLKLYEHVLERMRRRDKRLPKDVLSALELRGNQRNELARKYVAQLFKVPYSTYLREVLKDARKLKRGGQSGAG
jgi:hypothetical protein